MKHPLTRRQFVSAASAISAFTFIPGHILGADGAIPAGQRINIAGIGVGGQGGRDIDALAGGSNIVALCDVDEKRSGGTFKKFPNAKRYKDFRKMFDEMDKEIDAVVVATPDHFHAVAAMAAIQRGKHVYCEKPLAHNIFEVRELMKAAKEKNVVTQLGNQGHSTETIRMLCEWVWDGAIGKVSEIHAGCNIVNSAIDRLPQLAEQHAVPATLDWQQWLGPALDRPYNPAYLPASWRGWVPFGNGTLGDWACHVIDPVFWALDLGAPATIQAQVKNYDIKTQGDAYPKGEIVTYEFAANGKRGPVALTWYTGTEKVPRPPELEEGRNDIGIGAVVRGDKGVITYGSHGAAGVRIIPETKMQAYKRPAPSIPRVKDHHQDWLTAIRTGRKAGSDFSYGGPLTEVALLGIIAVKLAGQKLQWDGKAGKFTNSEEANGLLKQSYRAGWTL